MSFLDIFKGPAAPAPIAAPAPAPQSSGAGNPGNIPNTAATNSQTAASAGTATNGTVPLNDVTKEGPAKSGLDAFADIWNTTAQQGTQGQPLFNVDQTKMVEAARKQNFNNGVSPELMAKITAGGDGAAQAMMEAMNIVAQNAYAQSAFATTQLIEGAVKKSDFVKSSDIDNRFKSLTVDNSLRSENPLFSHPAAQPLLNSVKDNLLVKYPNATPNELSEMANTYLREFVKAANAPQAAADQAAQAKVSASNGTDWSKFL